jgi:starch synthase
MENRKVLYVSQDITPYLKDSPMGKICRYLPQGIQERGMEIRTFMPRFGHINERRNQLHEVIRLSGMNLVIDDTDHPLIIKVASIQSARMQIYFIDNEDFFHRKFSFRDKNGMFYEDNDERSIFFARGVLETVKKLGWPPNLVHCHGWLSSLVPYYVRKLHYESPVFSDSRIVVSVYDDGFAEPLAANMRKKVLLESLRSDELPHLANPDYVSLMKTAIDYSDGIIIAGEHIHPELEEYIRKSGKAILEYQGEETYLDAYHTFYGNILDA